MEAIHPDLYRGTPKAQLEADVARLEASAPTANDDEMMVGLLRIVARVSAKGRNGHTGAFIWGSGTPVHSLPLRLWLFADGLYVVDALPPYQQLVGTRVDSIAGHPTARVLAALEPLIPHDNATTVKLLVPRYLLIPEILHGLGLIGAIGPVTLGVVGRAAQRRMIDVEPVPMSGYNQWAGPYGLHLPPIRGVLYLSRSEDPLWFKSLASSGTLYVQYNRVEWLSSALLGALEKRAKRADVRRIVVDIRHNFGGETHASEPVLDILESLDEARTGHLFVITGRNTFSAAALFAADLERKTRAVFAGEPMGGSPNLYGNSREVSLPFSGLVVSVASEYFVRSVPGDRRLTIEPDILIPLKSADYFAGRDLALAAILKADR